MSGKIPHIGRAAFGSLLRRELTRAARQPARIIGAVATPLLVLAVLAGGLAEWRSDAVAGGAGSLTGYLAPGIAALTVMFSAIFAAIGLIEDRESGVLRAAVVGPAPAWSLALGKCAAAGLIAFVQGAAVFAGIALLAPLGGGPAAWAAALASLACVAMGTAGISLTLAWRARSVGAFHGVMNAVLMPMWLLGGTVFPVADAAGWMRALMLANPLTWTLAAGRPGAGVIEWAVCFAFAALPVVAATLVIGKGRRHL